MARVANPKQYDRFIAAVIRHLKIKPVKIEWRSIMRKSIAASAYREDRKIRIGKGFSKEFTMEIIAHELRHIWQYDTGIFTGLNTWNGVEYNRTPITRGKVPTTYNDQPWEADAVSYSIEAVARFDHLFGHSAKDVEPVLFSNGNVNYKQTAIKAHNEGTSPFFTGVDKKKMQRTRKILGY